MKSSTTGKWPRSTWPRSTWSRSTWFAFRGAVLRRSSARLDRGWYRGQPCACWGCQGLRDCLSRLHCCKQAVGTESDQAREDLHAGPGQTQLRQRAGLQGSC